LSLKLRLNLIITGLLLLIMLAGAVLNIIDARQNARAEIASAEKLALYLFDTPILNGSNAVLGNLGNRPFQLQRLNHMRHLRIELRDVSGRVVDSNQAGIDINPHGKAPDWFGKLLNAVTPRWESTVRQIKFHDQILGELVITPDPSYEYAEIWKQISDLLVLASIFFVSVSLMIAWAVGQALKPTEKILIALTELERGNLEARLPLFDLPELSRIGEKFNRMIETLQQSISRNHRLSQQLISLQEAERKSLARDLHDEFGQCLTAINTDATVVLKHAEKKYPELHASALAISEISHHLIGLVSGLLQQLRPGILDELGLAAALDDLVNTWRSRNKNTSCTIAIRYSPKTFDEVTEVTAYRLVQECLTNITRHAAANLVDIQVHPETRALKSGLLIGVRDNGKGFDETTVDGLGLAGMRERVEGLGGEFILNTRTGKGTEIRAWIPMKDSA